MGGRGGGRVLSGGGSRKKILQRKGVGHYMKNKNIWGCILSTQPDQQKRPQCKNAQKMQKKKKKKKKKIKH